MSRIVNPEGWPQPSGYNNGVAASGTGLFIAGQIGCDESGTLVSDDVAGQSAQALRNILAVLQSAGGAAEHLVRLTWYVTDKGEYTAQRRRIGEFYREIVGTHYPAMTLVAVAALLHDGAKVEIEATAVLP